MADGTGAEQEGLNKDELLEYTSSIADVGSVMFGAIEEAHKKILEGVDARTALRDALKAQSQQKLLALQLEYQSLLAAHASPSRQKFLRASMDILAADCEMLDNTAISADVALNNYLSSNQQALDEVKIGAYGKYFDHIATAFTVYDLLDAACSDDSSLQLDAVASFLIGKVVDRIVPRLIAFGFEAAGITNPIGLGVATFVATYAAGKYLEGIWTEKVKPEVERLLYLTEPLPATAKTFFGKGDAVDYVVGTDAMQGDVMLGGAGDDHFLAGFGADVLFGGSGGDVLEGQGGNDTLIGDDGDDVLDGGIFNDRMEGGEGNDNYRFKSADFAVGGSEDTIFDSDGHGWIEYNGINIAGVATAPVRRSDKTWTCGTGDSCFLFSISDPLEQGPQNLYITHLASGNRIVVEGWTNGSLSILLDGAPMAGQQNSQALTNSDDLIGPLWGATEGDDVISGEAGNDGIDGGDGNDWLDGGWGDDFLLGGAGDNRITGADGNDVIICASVAANWKPMTDADFNAWRAQFVDNRTDVLASGRGWVWYTNNTGSAPIVQVAGANGSDFIDAGFGDDYAYAGDGADEIDGGEGNDELLGGAGSDILIGGLGNDLLNGDSGSNQIPTLFDSDAEDGNDLIDAGDGDDFVDGEGGGDHIDGGNGIDTIFGGAGSDVIDGGAGDDSIDGDRNDGPHTGDGADSIHGGTGKDNIWGGGGADEIYGDEGDDTIAGDNTDSTEANHGADVIRGGAGADSINGQGGNDWIDGGTEADLIFGGTGDDRLYGGAGNDDLEGNEGNDVLAGEYGADLLFGHDGNDVLDGGADNDHLEGGKGNDTILGGEGQDQLYGDEGDDYLDGGLGNDAMTGDDGNDLLHGGDGNDLLLGVVGDDSLYGDRGGDQLVGGDGADLLEGGEGDDALQGDAGSDDLRGGEGRDTLAGGDGDDLLDGGAGSDLMSGGAGSDTFVFSGAWGDDRVVTGAMEDGELDVLHFTDVDELSDLSVYRQGNSLILSRGADSIVTVFGFFAGDHFRIKLADGPLLTVAQLYDVAVVLPPPPPIILPDVSATNLGSGGNDTLNGTAASERLEGGAGNDTIVGDGPSAFWASDGSADIIVGGAGDDAMTGGPGNDVYLFNKGFGHDVVNLEGWYAGDDTLAFNFAFDPSFSYEFIDGSLVLKFSDTGDTVDIRSSFYYPSDFKISFANGVVLHREDFMGKLWNRYGGDFESLGGWALVDGQFGSIPSLEPVYLSNGQIDLAQQSNSGNDVWDLTDGGSWPNWWGPGAGSDTIYFNGTLNLAADDPDSSLFLQGNDRIILVQDSHMYDSHLWGLGGDDLIMAGSNFANVMLFGGLGNDVLIGRPQEYDPQLSYNATMSGGDGDDQIYSGGRGRMAGNDGNDRIIGGIDTDLMTGDAGDDYLEGAGGDDKLWGGTGNDTLLGGEGDDWVFGSTGDDFLDGGNGNDLLQADAGDAQIFGGGGIDQIHKNGTGGGSISGGSGDDWIWVDGATGELSVDGGSGVDAIFISNTSAKTLVTGGEGDDSIIVNSNNSGEITVAPGEGRDFVSFSGDQSNSEYTSISLRLARGGGEDEVLCVSAQGQPLKTSIEFEDTLSTDEVEFARTGDNLVVSYGNGDSVVFYSFFPESPGAPEPQASVRFADGVTLTQSEMLARLIYKGTEDADYIYRTTDGPDRIFGLGGDDFIEAGDGDDVIFGGDGIDVLRGSKGSNTIYGGNGTDYITAWTADADDVNRFIGGAGDDFIYGTYYSDIIEFNEGDGHDTIFEYGATTQAGDTLRLGEGIDAEVVAVSRDSADLLLDLGAGESIRVVNWFQVNEFATDSAVFAHALNTIEFADGTVWDEAAVEALLAGTGISTNDVRWFYDEENNLEIFGSDFADRITTWGGYDAEILHGYAGADVLDAKEGDDLLFGGMNGDIYVLRAGSGQDTIEDDAAGSAGADIVRFEDVTSTQVSSVERIGQDLVIRYADTDVLTVNRFFSGTNWRVEEFRFSDGVTWTAVDVLGRFSADGTEGDDTLVGDAGVSNSLSGFDGDDNITGAELADELDGGNGNDFIDGAGGADRMVGGADNDVFVVDDLGDVVVELSNEGTDTVRSSISLTLADNVENLELTGATNLDGTGNALANVLTGNAGDNLLDGGAGADRLVGGLGNDTFVVDDAGDVVVESAGEGTDTVRSAISLTLAANVENLVLTGSNAINGTGNASDNVLTGNSAVNILDGGAGNDTLDGGAGADTLKGGTGDDTYIVDTTGEVVTELANQGTDTVQSSITYTLAANVENLTLTGTAAINGTGNTLANLIVGNEANNSLNGGAGADTLKGGAGNDTYTVDNTGDQVIEAAGEGTDKVNSSVSYTLSAEVENLTLTGSATTSGTGNELNNVLTGNAAANTITGAGGNDTLSGGAGADTLAGGTGDDGYVVDDAGDQVIELAGEGTDTVSSSVSYALSANVEKLTLTGTNAINGTGNADSNVLTGNAAANVLSGLDGDDTLNGGAGADTLVGGAGNDGYIVDDAGDVVVEAAGEGTDTVSASVNFTLADNVENLTLTGSVATTGAGNAADNVIVGNGLANQLSGGAGNDSINGGTGNDTMAGGTGDDTFYVNAAGDIVVENEGEGTDTIISAASLTLAANVENLTLTGTSNLSGTGNALANVLVGNAGNNTLNGGAGADTLQGGLGNDTYLIDDTGDVVVENAGEGTDTASSSVTYTLSANVENLTLTGTASIDGTGNAGDNVLTGNSAANVLSGGAGNDTLNGGAGVDTMYGGAGNDTFIVSQTGDLAIENAAEGIDTVNSAITLTLGANLENLTLTGGSALKGTGNTLDNVLTGNTGANTLTGLAGNDTLDGGLGNDTLVGGDGNDTYLFQRTGGQDTITNADTNGVGTDVLKLDASVSYDQLWFQHVGNDLLISIIGTTDTVKVAGWYAGAANQLDQIQTASGNVLTTAEVTNLVNAMASFTPPPQGTTTLDSSYSALMPTIAANWTN